MAPSENRHQNGNILGNSDTGSIDRRTNQKERKALKYLTTYPMKRKVNLLWGWLLK